MATTAAPTTDSVSLPAVDKIIADLETAMAKVREPHLQYMEYERILSQVTGNAPAPARAAPGARAPGTRGGQRDQNLQEVFVNLVRENPGQQIPVYAGLMKKQPGYVYKLRDKARANNQVREQVNGREKTYFPVEPGEPSAERIAELEAAGAK